ncbi:putative quinol monooxygenase [Flavobacterium silvaticum]|uniref:Antibiotic biosynthesis monooxygenase n=1 Tax=Flavobacterium silvaticum TaxID=1852020 RepID=A0A972JFE6_9FLAO|nr:putative quinol monooxygenase [Flavobacterium silvaticum]NMH27131.1 antibiotic biosynthesis monooxygenase [Flavobacterium silvaticum]
MEKELIVKWKIKESGTARVLELLQQMATETKKEKGNIFYNIYQSEDNPNELFLHERYTNPQALEDHKNSTHYNKIVAEQIIPLLETREVVMVKQLF